MTDYINRGALPTKRERGFYLDDDFNAGWNACLEEISKLPAADVRENKRGKWTQRTDHWTNSYICSVCGHKILYGTDNFCPNCGAWMEGC